MRRAAASIRLDGALVALVVGFAFSLAANLLWTWDGGIVRILGGALASCALPGAIHLWPRIPIPPPVELPLWPGGWTLRLPVMRMIRALVMTAIALMAAYTTFSHAAALLVLHGEDPVLAALYPVMTELLVVMGVLARQHASVQVATDRARKQRGPKARAARPAAPAVAPRVPTQPADTSSADVPSVGKRAAGIRWARAHLDRTGELPTGAAIAAAVGASKPEGDRIRARVKRDTEAAS